MRYVGIRGSSGGGALGIALVCNLLLLAGVTAQATAAQGDACAGLRPPLRSICGAYVIGGCTTRSRPQCSVLRTVYTKLSGSAYFPFEYTPTPTSTPTLTSTPTATATPVSEVHPPAGLQPGSVVIFPQIIANDRDTVVQLVNASLLPVNVHCFYSQLVVPGNPQTWQEIDFQIALQRQQPTHWAASCDSAPNFDPYRRRIVTPAGGVKVQCSGRVA